MTTNGAASRRDQPSRWSRLVPRSRWDRRRWWWAAVVAVLAGYAWVDASAAPFSERALIGVLIPGAVLAAIACGPRPERLPAPDKLDPAGMSYWVIAIAALFEWEASAYKDNSLPWHPSLTNILNPLIAPHLIKSAVILVWMLGGWELVKR